MSYKSPYQIRQERDRDRYERWIRFRYDHGQKVTRQDKKESPYNEVKKAERATRDVNGRGVHFTTNGSQLLSLILILSLIATVFVAYQNSISEGDSILYFSPANYFSRLSNPVVSSSGSYPLYYDKYNSVGIGILDGYYAFIIIGGQKYNSENSVSYFDLGQSSTTFVFVINGDRVSSRIASDDDPKADGSIGMGDMFPMPDRVVDLKSGDVGNLTLPDISLVGEAWSSVGGVDFVNDIARAFSVTGDFIISSVNYEIGIIGKLLPWNFFVDGNSADVGMPRDYLPDLWEKAEETWKENAE